MKDKEYLLELNNICKSFSGVKVLQNINLFLDKGKVLGLVGENGAGKSTLMNIIGGIHKPDEGKIYMEGKEISHKNPLDALEKGIAFVHQELNLFHNLTVTENIYITNFPKNKAGAISYKKITAKAKAIISELDENIDVNKRVEELTMGQCQLVEIAKAIEHNAKIVIFDEPTTSLSNNEKEKLFAIIRKLASGGVGIIYISHILDDVFYICDEIMAMRDGHLIGQKKKEDTNKAEIIEMMIGRSINQLYPYTEKQLGNVILEVKHLNQGKKVKNVSFCIREGEILGLFGLMGAGRSEMARAIFGVEPFDSGEIYVHGKKMEKITPTAMIDRRVAFITENRREEGLLMPKTVKENLSLAYLKEIKGKFDFVKTRQENQDTDEIIKSIQIKTNNKNRQVVRNLSGGNQQKVVIGKWMLTNPKVFILDEPTRGIDVGAKYEIYNYINELVKNKSAVLFISSEMEELMGVCDRIMVMSQGKLAGELQREEYSPNNLMELAVGGL